MSEHRDTITVPDEIMKEAEATLDCVLCNCKEAGDVRYGSIMTIARALISAEARGMERAAKICDRLYPVYVTGKGFRMDPAETDIEHVGNAYAAAIRNGTEA